MTALSLRLIVSLQRPHCPREQCSTNLLLVANSVSVTLFKSPQGDLLLRTGAQLTPVSGVEGDVVLGLFTKTFTDQLLPIREIPDTTQNVFLYYILVCEKCMHGDNRQTNTNIQLRNQSLYYLIYSILVINVTQLSNI